MGRCSGRGTRNRQQKVFGKVLISYIEKFDQFLMTKKKYRLGLLFTGPSQHFGIYLVAFALKFFVEKR